VTAPESAGHRPRIGTSPRRVVERFKRFAGGVSVRTKILGIVLTLTTVLGLGVTLQVRAVMNRTLIGELDSRGESVVSDVAARATDPILLNDNFRLVELLRETVDNHPDVLYAFITGPDGDLIAHTFGDAGFPTALLGLRRSTPTAIDHVEYRSVDGVIHDFAAPIFDGRAGTARVGLSENRMAEIVNATTAQMLLTTMTVGLAGLTAALLLTWLLTRPILDLVETTRAVGGGDLTVRASEWADDEIGTLAHAFNVMVDDLAAGRRAIEQNEAARTRLLQQLMMAQEEERKRIARELHDSVGQALNSIQLGVGTIARTTNRAEAEALAADLRTLATETVDLVRRMGRQLRPSVLDDLGLEEALEHHAEEFRALYPEILVEVHVDLEGRLPSEVETALYRIVQEAMTNTAHHAEARTLSVLVTSRNGQVRAIIEDDGHGFSVTESQRAANSVGIHGMKERAELLGGSIEFESGSNGTAVFIEVPL